MVEQRSIARWVAAGLSLAAICTLGLQTAIDLVEGKSLGRSLWDQFLFFTNISILIMALICGWAAARGWPGASWPAGLVVWMVITGLVYHVLLAASHSPERLDILVNLFQHTILPVTVTLAWIVFAPKAGLSLRDPLLWALYPILYAVYGLLRGLMGFSYPYFFLDPVRTGWPGVGAYILGLAVLFFAVGALLVAAARVMPRAS